MNGLSIVEPRQDAPARMAAAEVIAAVVLGLFGFALLSGRAVFAAVIGVTIIAVFASSGLRQTFHRWREAITGPMVVGTTLVLIAFIPSTVLSEMPWVSLQVHVRMVLFSLVGALIYAYFIDRPKAHDLFVRTMFISLAIGLSIAIVALSAFPLATYLLQARGLDNQHHAVLLLKSASSGAVLICPLAVWAAWSSRRWWRVIGFAVAVALPTVTYLTESRSGLAGVVAAAGIAAFALLLRRESRRLGIWFLLGFVAVGGLIATYLIYRDIAILIPQEELVFPPWLIDPHRQLIWSFGLELVGRHPWLGWGINTINLVPAAANAPIVEPVFNVMPGHPHNWVIEVFAETGVVGGVPMVVAVVALFVGLMRRFKETGDTRFVVMLAVSGAFWASSLFNFSFWSAWWQILYVLIVALICASRPLVAGHGEAP